MDERGAVVPPAEVEGSLDIWSADQISVVLAELVDDGAGGFRVTIHVGPVRAPSEQRTLLLTRGGARGTGARLDVTNLGTNQLGVVRLAPPPLLVAGRVRGPDGAPAVFAQVDLERRWMGARRAAPQWSPGGVYATCDREGRFELRGWVGTDELRVVARAREGVPVAQECRAGAAGVELAFVSTGSIRGTLVLPRPCGLDTVEIECLRHAPPHQLVTTALPSPDGAFQVVELEPGSYDLRVHAYREPIPVALVEDVQVRTGEETADPRVAALDLRGRIRLVHVSVELPPGVPVDTELPFATLFVRPPDCDALYVLDTRDARSVQGSFDFATARSSVDLVLDTPGWRAERLRDVSADRAVVLRPGLPVRLELRGGLPALAPGFELRAELEPVQRDFRRTGSHSQAFDERGTVRLRASDPGAHRVRFIVEPATGDEYLLPTEGFHPAQIEVADGAGPEASVSVEIDAQVLAGLLAKIVEPRHR